MAQDSAGRAHSERGLQFTAIDKAAGETCGKPCVELAVEAFDVEQVACEIKRVAGRDAGNSEIAKPHRQRIDSEPGTPPGPDRVALADAPAQLEQRFVD